MALFDTFFRVSVAAITLTASGCAVTPRSGPADGLFEAGATAKSVTKDRKVGIDYALVDINKNIVALEQGTGATSLRSGFGTGGDRKAPDAPLGVGDVVSVSVFESGSGGLFIPADAGSRPGNYVTLPQQIVDRAGTISIPYAGRIQVAGKAIPAVQTEIEKRLENRAIEPQVVITVVSNKSRQVAVLGDVNDPAKLEISEAGERILDVIARAGGLSTPGIETYVTLQRRGRQATVLFNSIVANSDENIYVVPGDTIYINRERRTYLAFGAAGLNGRFDFEEANLTLGEALGKAGGLLDARADPKQVYLYRTVERNELAKMGVDVSKFSTSTIPVIFRANLRDPAAFFATQKFAMHDKDILYVSNATSVEVIKFLDLVNAVSSTSSGVAVDAANAKTAVRTLRD